MFGGDPAMATRDRALSANNTEPIIWRLPRYRLLDFGSLS